MRITADGPCWNGPALEEVQGSVGDGPLDVLTMSEEPFTRHAQLRNPGKRWSLESEDLHVRRFDRLLVRTSAAGRPDRNILFARLTINDGTFAGDEVAIGRDQTSDHCFAEAPGSFNHEPVIRTGQWIRREEYAGDVRWHQRLGEDGHLRI